MNPIFNWGTGSSYGDAVQNTLLIRPPHHYSMVGKMPFMLGRLLDAMEDWAQTLRDIAFGVVLFNALE